MSKIHFAIGNREIGEGQRILIQTMSDHKTSDVDYQVEMTNRLETMGLDLNRFSVLDFEDAKAFKEIKARTHIPLIADIHFDYRFALEAVANGADKIRINPGNIGSESNLREVIHACRMKGVPMRIGVNSGSLNKYRGKGSDPLEDYFLALDDTLRIFRDENFDHLVLSLKTSDPDKLTRLYETATTKYPYPLHIGLTESGFGTMGSIKSAIALYPLLEKGIGDTIRVSLADDRKEELRAIKTLLRLTHRDDRYPELIVCPGCGRTQIDLKPISRLLADRLDTVFKPVKIACMGCPVNGIGEARNADFGIAGSGAKDIYVLFSHGKPLGTFPKEEALTRLYQMIEDF